MPYNPVLLTQQEMKKFLLFKDKLERWISIRRIASYIAVFSLLQVPLVWYLTKGGKLHPAIVSIVILLAIWSWMRLKYHQDSAKVFCQKIEKRHGS